MKNGLKTIAFPAISTGAYGYPVEDAARIALEAGKKYEYHFNEIKYVCFSKRDFDIYKRIHGQLAV